jgi:folate-binding protein YgfZ
MSNPFVDQRRAVEGSVVVPVVAGVVRVTGADRHLVLGNVLTQELGSLTPGESRESLGLDGNGRIERVVHVREIDDATILIAPGQSGADLATWIDARVFLEDVHAVDVSNDFSVWGGTRALGPLAWTDPWPTIAPGGVTYNVIEPPAWDWVETLLPAGERPEVDVVDADVFDAIRVIAGRPVLAEVDERSLPHELDWLRTAVHLAKGCYPGQETVAKIHNVGHPPRRLVRLHLDGSESVFAVAGDAVFLGDDEVGRITTAGVHFEEGPVALAVIKRSVDVAAQLSVDHDGHRLSATQEVVVPPTAGATAAERLRPSRP